MSDEKDRGALWGVSSLETPEGKEALRQQAERNRILSQQLDAREGGLRPEKPLHVRVAEVLGAHIEFRVAPWYRPHENREPTWMRRCVVGEHVIWPQRGLCAVKEGEEAWTYTIPRYDTDWSATGPLIEKYRFATWTAGPLHDLVCESDEMLWRCNSDDRGLQQEGSEVGATPLIAACNLILALATEGKLAGR